MPELACLKRFLQECQKYAGATGKVSGLPADHPDEHGMIILFRLLLQWFTDIMSLKGLLYVHEDMLASSTGNKQTISFHHCPSTDPDFCSMPPAWRDADNNTCTLCPQAPEGEDAQSEVLEPTTVVSYCPHPFLFNRLMFSILSNPSWPVN